MSIKVFNTEYEVVDVIEFFGSYEQAEDIAWQYEIEGYICLID